MVAPPVAVESANVMAPPNTPLAMDASTSSTPWGSDGSDSKAAEGGVPPAPESSSDAGTVSTLPLTAAPTASFHCAGRSSCTDANHALYSGSANMVLNSLALAIASGNV